MEIFEDEKEVLMEGEFDGIRELNNGLPPWLMWLFYLTIFWGAVYMVHYHTYKQGDLQETEYAKEVAAANKNKGKIEELKEIKLFTDAANIGEGSKLFVQRNCITCHGNNGEGNTVGPNLTDEYWINGGTPMQIFTMIKNGNIAKGMMPFKDQLTDKQTIQLASFILNKLQGSNPANAKAPQGEKIAKKMSNESFRNQTATYQNGKRKWIYARQPKGKYYTYRSFVGWILFAFLLVAPFIRINENPLLMFNFLERRFSIFGSMFTPQDSFIFLVIMISFLLFIILFTAVYGRVFCGWICPQTIFMETIFRRLEYLIEGNAHRQQELNQRAWDAEKIIIKTLKYSVFFAISFLLSNLALIYLVGADEWLHRIQSPIVEYKTSFIVTFLFAVLIYTIYSLVREQLCLIVCPYGRLQGILLDSDSIVVSYDHKRCEDCLDDKLCVHVCPTGIDIRNGTQLECINCMACIDACNSVMKRANRSTGLIRLDSKRGILEGKSSIVRPRSIIYSILLVSILMFLVILLSCRNPFEVSVFRTQGTLYQEYDKGQISNMYNLKFINKTQDKQSIEVKLLSAKGSLQTMQRLDIEKYATGETVFLVYINRKEIDFEKIKLGIYANKKLIKTLETNFVSPR